MTDLRAVIFDWRGTLVVTLTVEQWVATALRRLGRDDAPGTVAEICARITIAAGEPTRLDAPGIDTDAARHRTVFHEVFADAGLDPALAGALYAIETDATTNHFAADAAPTLRTLAARGVRIAVLSDIHFDIRPAFATAGLTDLVDVFVLSFEHGLQKPDPAVFDLALRGLGTPPDQTLMVGDRRLPDGAAVELGMPTLLLPPLTGVSHQRLHHVTALFGATPDHRPRWIVWRQDDNGNRYEVARKDSRPEAEALATQMDARGHKQLYWVAPAT